MSATNTKEYNYTMEIAVEQFNRLMKYRADNTRLRNSLYKLEYLAKLMAEAGLSADITLLAGAIRSEANEALADTKIPDLNKD